MAQEKEEEEKRIKGGGGRRRWREEEWREEEWRRRGEGDALGQTFPWSRALAYPLRCKLNA